MALSVASLALEVGRALAPLERRLRAGEVRLLMAELGLPAPDAVLGAPGVTAALDAAGDALAALPEALSDLAGALASGDGVEIARAATAALPLIEAAATAIDAVATALSAAAERGGPARAEVEAFAGQFAERLLGYALASSLERRRPVAARLLALLGVLDAGAQAATPAAPAHIRRAIRFERLAALIEDPVVVLADVYRWGTPEFDWEGLLLRLSALGRGASGFAFVDPGPPPVLRIAVIDVGRTDDPVPGVTAALRLGTPERLERHRPLGERAVAFASVDAALAVGTGIELLPPAELRVVPPAGQAGGRLRVGVQAPPTVGADPIVVLGTSGGSRVEARLARVAAGADLAWDDGSGRAEGALVLEAALEGGKVVLELGEADGFLAAILPSPIELDVDAGVAWSSETGLHFDGETGLRTTRAVNRTLGLLRLDSVGLRVVAAPEAVTGTLSLSGSAALGPVTASVDALGAAVAVRPRRGNLGPIDAGASFVGPAGIGLAIDTATVSGGGFLAFDPAAAQYAGALALELSGIAVKAVGVLTTRLPGGAPGYSLLILISAEFTPVSLGMGFTLNGVGGLVGINRTAAVDALRAGVKTGALGAVLSPPDPVAHAPALVASLSALFPAAPGRHVVGPLAKLGWGSPTLITIDLCVVLELPAPVRLIVLGRLRAKLPEEHEAVVVLQMDLLGVVDFDRREAAVDATLVDSRLASFALTGDMAMRLSWGPRPTFLLAVGGFHPGFQPPPGFPALERVAVALASGNNPRLRLEAYLALTSNTVQFGARLELLARAGRFSLEGTLSFDALVQLRPLAFTVDIAARLAVRAGSRTLLSVSLALTLSGPQPWRARGRASFSILFLDISFRFDVTIGEEPPLGLPARVDVAPLVLAALRDPRAWDAQLPAGGVAPVTLRAVAAGADVLAHPLGTLQVRQRVAPLERTLERFGDAEPAGARRFAIGAAVVGTQAAETDRLEDLFAPGHFRTLSDDEQLSLPSFESMPSGVRIGERDVAHGPPVEVAVVYEQRVITGDGGSLAPAAPAAMPDEVLRALTGSAADGADAAPTFALRDIREPVLAP